MRLRTLALDVAVWAVTPAIMIGTAIHRRLREPTRCACGRVKAYQLPESGRVVCHCEIE